MNRTEAELEAYKLAAENAATRMQHAEASLEVWKRNYQHIADQLYASCICGGGPDICGPEEDCPVHGADEYRPLALRRRARQAEADLKALTDVIARYDGQPGDAYIPIGVLRDATGWTTEERP